MKSPTFSRAVSAILSLASLLLLLGLVTPTQASANNDDVKVVYRADMLSPDDLKQQGGFFPRGSDGTRPNQLPADTSLYNHVQGGPTGMSRINSGYVSTTADLDFARRFVQTSLNGRGYIYTIRPTPNFIDAAATLRDYYPHTEEQEYAALGNIHLSQVVSWREVINGREGRIVSNPRYDSRFDSSRSGGAQPHLAGFPPGHRAWSQEPWRSAAVCIGHDELRRSIDTIGECKPSSSSLDAAQAYMDGLDYMYTPLK